MNSKDKKGGDKLLSKSTKLLGVFALLLIFVVTVVFYLSNEKGADFIFQNLKNYEAKTIPYDKKIKFKLSSDEILKGIDKPLKIASIYNTEVFITEITEVQITEVVEKKYINKREIFLTIEFIHQYKSPQGKMLSLRRLNDNNTFTGATMVQVKAYNDKQEPGYFGTGSTSFDGYDQYILFFEKEELITSKEWFFEISGLNVLTYKEK